MSKKAVEIKGSLVSCFVGGRAIIACDEGNLLTSKVTKIHFSRNGVSMFETLNSHYTVVEK